MTFFLTAITANTGRIKAGPARERITPTLDGDLDPRGDRQGPCGRKERKKRKGKKKRKKKKKRYQFLDLSLALSFLSYEYDNE